ncbi:MAG: hypothetical protein EHM42_15515, partial [Planctomycetaceae bacterium]
MESGQSRDLNAVIDAFERCQSQSGPVDFAEFLPARANPRFEAIALELVRVDIEYSWNRRLPRSLDDYRRQIPELFVDPRDRALIAFEEYRQRRRAGERATREEYARRLEIDVSDWDEVACPAHDEESQIAGISSSSTPDDSPPLRPGASFAGFELVRELGRGSSSRVFLARQPSLALRHVVLKISLERTVEPDRLARLQHTNIMPIHSFHQVGEWHAICMPYFGSFVLSDWVEHLRERRTPPVTSEELETLHAILRDATWTQPDQGDSSSSPPAVPLATTTITAPLRPEGLTRRNEGRQSYEQTVVALAARLARALGHAHDHGVLHLDLKPANILLTPDGEPMLLDFHLSTADGAPEGGRLYVGG